MPAAPTLELHANGRYYVHWIEGRRTLRVSTRTGDLAEAQEFFGGWLLGDKRREKRTAATLSFIDVWQAYVEEVAKGTVGGKRMPSLTPRFEKAFGSVTAQEIGPDHFDKYVRDRRAGRLGRVPADSTIWLELTKAKAAINHAVRRKRIANPAVAGVRLPVLAPEARDRWLRPEEFAKLITTASARREGPRLSRMERFLMIAIETGARCHMIERMTWSQVDLETGVIHYHRQGDVRSKKRRPSVPISRALRPVLERAYAERTGELVLDVSHSVYGPLHRLAARAGLADVTPHVLRHTAATWMARRGVPLWKIAGILGNSARMVETVYAKHSPDGLIDAVEMISAGAGPSLAA